MSLIQIDRLSRQTQHKSHTISRLHTEIECLKSDIQAQKQLIARIQAQKRQQRKQTQLLKRKQEEQQYERQNVQNRYLMVLQKLQQQVEQGKQKFYKLHGKISPMVEYDTVRLSIMNQLTQQHELQMQKYKHTIEIQKQQIHRLKRQKTLVQHKFQSTKIDCEDRLRQLSNSVKNQASQNQLTAFSLQMSKQIESKLKSSYETVRKQAEYYKQKYFTTQKKYQDKILSLQREIKNLRINHS